MSVILGVLGVKFASLHRETVAAYLCRCSFVRLGVYGRSLRTKHSSGHDGKRTGEENILTFYILNANKPTSFTRIIEALIFKFVASNWAWSK